MARGSQTWVVTPSRRDPRAVLYIGGAAGTLAAAPCMWMVFVYGDIASPPLFFRWVLVSIALVGVLWALVAFRLWHRRVAQTVTVGRDVVTIEGSPTSLVRVRVVPCHRIESLEPSLGSASGFTLWLRGMTLPVAIGGRGADPEVLETVAARIRDQIGELPDGPERLARMEAKVRVGSPPVGRVPIVLLATELLIMASMVAQWMTGSFPFQADTPAMAFVNIPDRVAAGELYRLVTANLLHRDAVHFSVNIMVLSMMGIRVEMCLGGRRMACLLAVSGILGQAIAAAWGSFDAVVGASGLVYGCFGALFWLRLRRGNELRGALRIPNPLWFLVGFGLIVESALPGVSFAVHLGGLLAGLLLTPVLVGRHRLVDLVGA